MEDGSDAAATIIQIRLPDLLVFKLRGGARQSTHIFELRGLGPRRPHP